MWFPSLFGRFHELEFEESVKFVSKWVHSHIEDGDRELKRPVMFTEFGYSNQNPNFHPSQRDQFFKTIFDEIYASARKNGAGAGSFVWQFLVGGMEEYNDDFGIVPWQRSSTYELITEHSCRLAALRGLNQLKGSLRELCLQDK